MKGTKGNWRTNKPVTELVGENMETEKHREHDIRHIAKRLGFEFHEYLEVLDVFLDNTPGVIEDFKLCLENNNLEEASELCHLIKGGASSIGLELISGVAHEIEKACKNGSISLVPALLEKLEILVAGLGEERKSVA